MKMRVFCHAKDCIESTYFEYDGQYRGNWYCPEHEKEKQEKNKNE